MHFRSISSFNLNLYSEAAWPKGVWGGAHPAVKDLACRNICCTPLIRFRKVFQNITPVGTWISVHCRHFYNILDHFGFFSFSANAIGFFRYNSLTPQLSEVFFVGKFGLAPPKENVQ